MVTGKGMMCENWSGIFKVSVTRVADRGILRVSTKPPALKPKGPTLVCPRLQSYPHSVMDRARWVKKDGQERRHSVHRGPGGGSRGRGGKNFGSR